MHTLEQVKQLVQQNIDQIKISEFAPEGGWPNIDEIEITIFNQKEENDKEVIGLDILYSLEKAGGCFIPRREDKMSLSKVVTIHNDKVKIE